MRGTSATYRLRSYSMIDSICVLGEHRAEVWHAARGDASGSVRLERGHAGRDPPEVVGVVERRRELLVDVTVSQVRPVRTATHRTRRRVRFRVGGVEVGPTARMAPSAVVHEEDLAVGRGLRGGLPRDRHRGLLPCELDDALGGAALLRGGIGRERGQARPAPAPARQRSRSPTSQPPLGPRGC